MTKNNIPKITFGIIVLNGEPFTRYCLRSLYPFAYEIIVVEGGHEDARVVCTPEGHSIDGTLETLRQFKEDEDPENKIQIITRDGFWPKRDELGRDRTYQSRAYAERATGDYLWQVDIDEFYRSEDTSKIISMLCDNPSITEISFFMRTFWASPEYMVDGWKKRRGEDVFRLFKWGPEYKYITHEPPTIHDEKGNDLRKINWVNGEKMAKQGIYLYHYAQLFPRQVIQKTQIYQLEKADYFDQKNYSKIMEWAQDNYLKFKDPFHVERHYSLPSWLVRFEGEHPKQIQYMMDDINKGIIIEELRETEDVEKILRSKRYFGKKLLLIVLDPMDKFWNWFRLQFIRFTHIPRKIKYYVNKL